MVETTSQVPRLTNAQYDRTIRDLLGVTTLNAANGVVPSTLLAADFSGGMTDLAWANYKDVADKISAQVIADPTLTANFMKCTPTAGDTTCLHQTAIDFGRLAFRRPLTSDEVARFDKVIAAGSTITPTGAPMEIAQALLYMFLISPTFIQRAETTENSDGAGHFTLSSTEIAQRLSYMLWGTTPDATLNTAADANMLQTTDQIAAQAQRMLQDPKARDMVSAFHQHYLLMDSESHWATASRDPSLFPNFDPSIVGTLSDETLKFFDAITFTPNSTFKDFLTSPIAFVNKDLAPLYGLDGSKYGTDLTQVTLDATQRPGFLTRLGFLMNFASYTRTNPIYRGAFISKQILGIDIPAPPPGATQTPLPTDATLVTNREQVDAQTSGDTCAGCHHVYINPPGFVMEAFDAMGAWRTTETNGAALDTTADITVTDGQPTVHVTNPSELMTAMATAPGALAQYVTQLVGYAYQRPGDAADACDVAKLAAKMNAGNYAILNLFSDLTQTQSFRLRAVEVSQ
ncbi:MAG TPA: DUF1592 domain-containing protein [Polyangiaceae bacterium]|nr:DUF1592 domain-containing protein [Polyangiaceae bacterium]